MAQAPTHALGSSRPLRALSGALVLSLAAVSSCSSADSSGISPGGSGGGDMGAGGGSGGDVSSTGTSGSLGLHTGPGTGDAGAAHPCVNLECQQTTCSLGACKEKPCAAGAKTTVSGTVYDPAGKVPLYNVIAYVPNAEVPAVPAGATCDQCSATAIKPVASAITDTKGHFVLEDVPVGSDVPLVLQVGKWRRQLKLPSVAACTDTPLTDKEQTRLPKNKSEGDMPLIAISVGGADSMECLPLRMGIDPAEFTTETGMGRVHLYAGHDDTDTSHKTLDGRPQTSIKQFDAQHSGATLSPSTALWAGVDSLKKYDVVILSCEGSLIPDDKSPDARKALYDYESLGGRVFGSHFHHIWFSQGPAPVPDIGTWVDGPGPASPTTAKINISFPKGKAMAEWLVNVGASMTEGQLQILLGRNNISAVNAMMATEWISLDTPMAVEFLSYNAPLNVADNKVCGRAVFNDLHVVCGGDDRQARSPVPLGVRNGRPVRSREGAGVHAFRPVVVRASGRRAARAAGDRSLSVIRSPAGNGAGAIAPPNRTTERLEDQRSSRSDCPAQR
jgi:hypothetical protein